MARRVGGLGTDWPMIYQAVGYKRARDGRVIFPPARRGERVINQRVAMAMADHLAQRYPDLIWTVETVGASQQVRR